MSDFDFLSIDDILELHADQIQRYGGLDGIRDEGLLQSAVAQPQATFDDEYLHTNIFQMAAAYAFHIAQNQPFLDGNKRTGLHAALIFLHFNGYMVPHNDKLYTAMMSIAERQLDKTGLADIFRKLAHPVS